MDLNDLLRGATDQEAGHLFELMHPVDGTPTGLKFTIAGPDSEKARAARLKLENAIQRASSRGTGRLSPDAREGLMIDFLFDVTLSWEVAQAGKPVNLTRETFGRVVGAGSWVRAQLDTFAGDRSPYYAEGKA